MPRPCSTDSTWDGASALWYAHGRRLAVACLAVVALAAAGDTPPVPYPDGFRSWAVVKSVMVGPSHPLFAQRGGLHHYYANEKAESGFRTGTFPEGATIVDEAVFTKDGDGLSAGLVLEGERRFIDVMVKDTERYASTGGWGYDHFERDERVTRLPTGERDKCAACHAKAPVDHVFSRMRP